MDLLNTITLTQLNYFYTVVNSKSVHEAAKKTINYTTQPFRGFKKFRNRITTVPLR